MQIPKHVWSVFFDQTELQESGRAPLINAINEMTSELGFDKVYDDISIRGGRIGPANPSMRSERRLAGWAR
jgi:hypothetical protein